MLFTPAAVLSRAPAQVLCCTAISPKGLVVTRDTLDPSILTTLVGRPTCGKAHTGRTPGEVVALHVGE
jgi:hypothetical protein